MEEITTIGLDIAKSVFQVHAVSAAGSVVVRRQPKRRYVVQFFAELKPCLIGIEACATARYWGRELAKLGHEVRLMPPGYPFEVYDDGAGLEERLVMAASETARWRCCSKSTGKVGP